jgi:predicted AlkP superfamily phosphohydrolase/phosphomutase
MSDHGFASFRRGFNLNTWLLEKGYITLLDPEAGRDAPLFGGVDWSRTVAYGLGLNGLYINQRGREKHGVVNDGAEKVALLQRIAAELSQVQDADGSQVIARTYIVSEDYPDADPQVAPDLLVGYARNYRAGWPTLLGGFSDDVLEDNRDRWSGDHCIAAHLVPGIMVSNRRIVIDDPELTDLAPTILGLFQLPRPAGLEGRPLLASQ